MRDLRGLGAVYQQQKLRRVRQTKTHREEIKMTERKEWQWEWSLEWHHSVKMTYSLDRRSPVDAAEWWQVHGGSAPTGTVVSLGYALLEIERLRSVIRHAYFSMPDMWLVAQQTLKLSGVCDDFGMYGDRRED